MPEIESQTPAFKYNNVLLTATSGLFRSVKNEALISGYCNSLLNKNELQTFDLVDADHTIWRAFIECVKCDAVSLSQLFSTTESNLRQSLINKLCGCDARHIESLLLMGIFSFVCDTPDAQIVDMARRAEGSGHIKFDTCRSSEMNAFIMTYWSSMINCARYDFEICQSFFRLSEQVIKKVFRMAENPMAFYRFIHLKGHHFRFSSTQQSLEKAIDQTPEISYMVKDGTDNAFREIDTKVEEYQNAVLNRLQRIHRAVSAGTKCEPTRPSVFSQMLPEIRQGLPIKVAMQYQNLVDPIERERLETQLRAAKNRLNVFIHKTGLTPTSTELEAMLDHYDTDKLISPRGDDLLYANLVQTCANAGMSRIQLSIAFSIPDSFAKTVANKAKPIREAIEKKYKIKKLNGLTYQSRIVQSIFCANYRRLGGYQIFDTVLFQKVYASYITTQNALSFDDQEFVLPYARDLSEFYETAKKLRERKLIFKTCPHCGLDYVVSSDAARRAKDGTIIIAAECPYCVGYPHNKMRQ